MIPAIAVVRWRGPDGRRLGLWIPLFLLWLLLLPLLLVMLPIVLAWLALSGLRPFRTVGVLIRFCTALRGTTIDVDSADRSFYLRLL